MSEPASRNRPEYDTVLRSLLSHEHVFYSPPVSPHKTLISQNSAPELPSIASLSLNPFLEALLHVLNCDLPAAHFLCRHAEVSPKYESMYVHGILHRVEGDIDNTRCWYRDVKDSDIFTHCWSEPAISASEAPEIAQKGWSHFLDRLERYRDRIKTRRGKGGWENDTDRLRPEHVQDWEREEQMLRQTSIWEIHRALEFMQDKFGTSEVVDAKKEFLGRIESGNEEHAQVAQNMVTGGEGWREF